MINFLNLPPKRQFLDPYLITHTGEKRSETVGPEMKAGIIISNKEKRPPNKNDGPYGTKRKSSEATAFKWIHTMDKNSISKSKFLFKISLHYHITIMAS